MPTDGTGVESNRYLYAKSKFDHAFRWYDDAIPYEFPEFVGAVSRTKGKVVRTSRTRGGYFFNAIGEWNSGKLAWLHQQRENRGAYYAIYFDLLPRDESPSEVPPRGWIGDGMPRCDIEGTTTMGADHCRVEVDDWNDDGLVDLIVGENYGHVFWWPNRGTRSEPSFPYCKFVMGADGLPLDAGMIAAPKVVDWDNDGAKDLLVGTEWNRILYYRNEGTNADRRMAYQGPVQIDGEPMELPIRPLTRGNEEVFRRDYYPVLDTVDWDNDGDIDLFAGGYITGQIFRYENTGMTENGTPRLRYRAPVETDGHPINVGHWCASPCLADLDADGDLDLLSGNMPMYETADERAKQTHDFLIYYENASSATQSRFVQKALPAIGNFPRIRLATPRVFDWDADGDLDLVVSSRENLFLYENEGSPSAPRFRLHSRPVPSRWGISSLGVDQFLDWNKDGRADLVNNYQVRLNAGVGNPYRWDQPTSALPVGDYIAHPSGIGDDWFWPYLSDFNKDRRYDVLFGDWHGHIWFHRNQSTTDARKFDLIGERLTLTNGDLVTVGPIGIDPTKSFAALQGARTVFTVSDFNRDGLVDLVIGDTYGKVRYFENVGALDAPRFAAPTELGDLGIRLLVDATDWNRDGWPDVVAGAANGKVRVFLNDGRPNPASFSEGFDPKLPPIAQPRVMMVDINEDGDEDLFLPSTQGSCFVERSFLENGYVEAALLKVEKHPDAN
ncbi:MAG: VCBS repeat-containing protein [Planctomycetes bacterium]|nr:VCBS repeat-containing protein [Planctomycetota bacterium]